MTWIALALLGLVISLALLNLFAPTGKPCICEDSDNCTCGGAWGGRK